MIFLDVDLCSAEVSESFFVSKNLCLLTSFLLSVEGLVCFFLASRAGSIFLVYRMKEKEVPSVSEKLIAFPWLASVWQSSKHLRVRAVFSSIFSLF